MDEKLKFGIHYVSQATTPEDAIKEAELIKRLSEYNPGYILSSEEIKRAIMRIDNENQG